MQKVVVLTTGGTIASIKNAQTGLYASGALEGEKLIDIDRLGLPKDLDISIAVESVFQVPSSAMNTTRLCTLYDRIMQHTSDPDVLGIVVTHGTDTLEESSYFMDLIYNGESPIVFTGAQRSPDEEGTDAFINIRDAIITASAQEARGLGVLVVFNEGIYAARTVHKGHAYKVQTFDSPEYGQLGFVDKGTCWIRQRPCGREYYRIQEPIPCVEIVKASLGSDGKVLQVLCDMGVKGIVIEGLGRGHVPSTWMEAIEYARQKNIIVVITTTCGKGRVQPVYDFAGGVSSLVAHGALMGHDYTSLKARIKLMVLLASGMDHSETLQHAFTL